MTSLTTRRLKRARWSWKKFTSRSTRCFNNLDDIVRQEAKQKGIEIVFSPAHAVPPALIGDPLRLGQILINLVNNAIKFTEKGRVIVEVKAEEAPAIPGSSGSW